MNNVELGSGQIHPHTYKYSSATKPIQLKRRIINEVLLGYLEKINNRPSKQKVEKEDEEKN